MNEFFKLHQRLVVSTVYLVAALLFAGYAILYRERQIGLADLAQLAKPLGEERDGLQKRLADLAKEEEGDAGRIRSLPDFLSRINGVAKKNGVVIRKLNPDQQNRFKFEIEILVDYYTFLHFAADLESLDTTITNIQVRPYDMGKTPPQHVIAFSITPRRDAEPLTGERIASLHRMVEEKDRRNPFQRFAYDAKLPKVMPEVDLTWIYKLSGTGKDQNGQYATIDRVDYYPGNDFHGKTITEVQPDRVYLQEETPNGKQRYVLKFRPASK